jgi:NADPH:quinone reductase-like Zn-dependent oxidoreductase
MSKRFVAASGWRYHKNGHPDKVLRFEKFRIPFDRSGQDVVVKMLAAPVHRQDKQLIEGTYGGGIRKDLGAPAVGGIEGVGIVEEVGSNAQVGVKEGDMVWINNQRVGTWSTHLVTDANNLDVLPNRAELDVEYLASMSLFHTAYHLTNSFVSLEPGDVVLQTGASSSVAQICQGMVRARGAKLIQTLQRGRTEDAILEMMTKLRGSFAVVPYNYARTNYMRRLLSDLPPPKLLLNHTCGQYGSQLVKLLGNGGTCVTYGNTSHQPMQIAQSDLIDRDIRMKHFFLPNQQEKMTREARMRVHQNCIENMTLQQGHGVFRAERFKMSADSAFAFSSAWDADLASRKPILRMVGEYGEWRREKSTYHQFSAGKAMWEDIIQELIESSCMSDQPKSMKYHTPIGDVYSTMRDAKESKELGKREVFFKRPNLPRHNSHETKL